MNTLKKMVTPRVILAVLVLATCLGLSCNISFSFA